MEQREFKDFIRKSYEEEKRIKQSLEYKAIKDYIIQSFSQDALIDITTGVRRFKQDKGENFNIPDIRRYFQIALDELEKEHFIAPYQSIEPLYRMQSEQERGAILAEEAQEEAEWALYGGKPDEGEIEN